MKRMNFVFGEKGKMKMRLIEKHLGKSAE